MKLSETQSSVPPPFVLADVAMLQDPPPLLHITAPEPDAHVRIRTPDDIITVRQKSRTLGHSVGFSASDLTILATAISEIARNIVEYAGEGDIRISLVREAGRSGVRVVATDDGPGISDLETVMADGFSTDGHLGIGLPGARRLMDTFHIVSAPGRGTTVTMTKWR
jgi:serine/threonine-protein kinase RsbT